MTMASQWKNEFEVLKNYIASNPEISIGMYETSIPEVFRDRFYMLFDNVRRAFVEPWISSFDFNVNTLGKSYIETENKLAESLKLKNMDLPVDLASFLHNPGEGMMRLIYDRLFELLQEKITEDDFEKMAEGDLTGKAEEMFRLGYEPWAMVSILQLLDPDEIMGIDLMDDIDGEADLFKSGLDRIVIGKQTHHPSKRFPEFIIHSKALDRYLAFKMPPAVTVDYYYLPVEIPTKRVLRDRSGDTSSILSQRMLFLSVVNDLNKLPVYADMHKRIINGPDLTIEFLMGHDLSVPGIIRGIQNRVEILKPRLGGNIVLIDNNLDSVPAKTETGIDIFPVGLAQLKLQSIIDKLA